MESERNPNNYPGDVKVIWRSVRVDSVWDENLYRRRCAKLIKDDGTVQEANGPGLEENGPDQEENVPSLGENIPGLEEEDTNTNEENNPATPVVNEKEEISYLPIEIGGGISIVILITGLILGYFILKRPDSKITQWFASFVE